MSHVRSSSLMSSSLFPCIPSSALHKLPSSTSLHLPSSRVLWSSPLLSRRSLASVTRRHVPFTPKAAIARFFDKESRLEECRTVYDHSKWANHRSTWRYSRHFFGILSSRIASGLTGPLLAILLLSTCIGVYETLRMAGRYIPTSWPSLCLKAPVAFNLSSFALSLLLVFRTNASYGRFDEGRKLWGGVVNRSRDLARQACNFFTAADKTLLEAFIRWGKAFPWVLKNHLREKKSLAADVQHILRPDELAMLLKSPHAPNTVMQAMGEIVTRARITAAQKLRIDENLTSFEDCVGACERILRTPIPVSYTRHTSRFLVIWLFLLPFTLWAPCGWGTVPSSVVLAYVLLAIEEIGVQIEEPFVILPLEAISEIIATNVQQHYDGNLAVKETVALYDPLSPSTIELAVPDMTFGSPAEPVPVAAAPPAPLSPAHSQPAASTSEPQPRLQSFSVPLVDADGFTSNPVSRAGAPKAPAYDNGYVVTAKAAETKELNGMPFPSSGQ